MPFTLGTKIIPTGARRAILWASCPAPLDIESVDSSSLAAASWDDLLERLISRRSAAHVVPVE